MLVTSRFNLPAFKEIDIGMNLPVPATHIMQTHSDDKTVTAFCLKYGAMLTVTTCNVTGELCHAVDFKGGTYDKINGKLRYDRELIDFSPELFSQAKIDAILSSLDGLTQTF